MMISDYVNAAMGLANYNFLLDGERFYAEVPRLNLLANLLRQAEITRADWERL